MTINMNNKWNPSWRERISKEGSGRILKEGALNFLPRLPNPMSNLLGANIIPNPRFIRKLRDYDIIHFIGEADLSLPLFSYFVKKPKLLQCVGIFRKGGIYKYYTSDRAYFGKIFSRIFPYLANRFVISSSEEKTLLKSLGVPEEKIVILPPSVDGKLFHPDRRKKMENMLLFVGRLDRIKGLHILLGALRYIKIPLKVVVIGPPWDLEYVKKIEHMVHELNQSSCHSVRLIGELDSKDMVSWYQKASILVCPYMYETHSNVVRESLACGTPVVSTGSHLVENRPDGILLAQQTPESLANVIKNILVDPEVCERLGKQGRSVIEQDFSWDSVIDKWIKLYADTVRSF